MIIDLIVEINFKELILDWMDTDGKHLDFPCLTIRQSLRGRALEVARKLERERDLELKKGILEMMKLLDRQYKKDRDSERLEKATEYFRIRRDEEEKVSEFLVRHEKIRNDWKRMERDQREMGGFNANSSSWNKQQ